MKDWERLKKTTKFKSGAQFKPGLKLCQHFCDNFWDIKNDRGVSFADCWQNPEIMDRVRQWGLEGMSKLWLSWIRRAVFMSGGLPNSSFYRPHFSKQIIQSSGQFSGTLFDPCAGWGGRMLGTVASRWKYVACEPNSETYSNLMRMVEFLDIGDYVQIHNMPVEDFDIESLKPVDVVLTSPPYFNLEVYNNSDTQSYNKFSSYETWSSEWLRPLIRRSLSVLSPDGISAWNVMNFKKYDLVDDVMSVHKELGWELEKTVGFDRSSKFFLLGIGHEN